MKLFRNPVFAVFFCLLLIVSSTCLNAKIKMEKRYDRVCKELVEEVIDYADDNGITELRSDALSASINGDYDGLIDSVIGLSSNQKYGDTDDVLEAIRDYTVFISKTQKFPATIFADLWHLSF